MMALKYLRMKTTAMAIDSLMVDTSWPSLEMSSFFYRLLRSGMSQRILDSDMDLLPAARRPILAKFFSIYL